MCSVDVKKKWVRHYTTERYYIMTVNRKVSGQNLPATYWQPGALQHQGTVEKVNLAHSFQQGGNREERRRKWSDQDPTTGAGGTAGHRLLSDCCVLKEGILYSNPRLLTYHQATFSNLLGFPSYSQLYIIIVTDLLKESGSVCTRTPAQKIGSHWWVTFSTSQYILIQRGENSWSSGEKPWSALGQKRWGIECGPFPLQAINGVNDQHTCILPT